MVPDMPFVHVALPLTLEDLVVTRVQGGGFSFHLRVLLHPTAMDVSRLREAHVGQASLQEGPRLREFLARGYMAFAMVTGTARPIIFLC